MRKVNRESLYLDGIENVENETLTYIDELTEKVKRGFGYNLTKRADLSKSVDTADSHIKNVIELSI